MLNKSDLYLSDEEINQVFGQDMSAIGDWLIDCRAVAKAATNKAVKMLLDEIERVVKEHDCLDVKVLRNMVED